MKLSSRSSREQVTVNFLDRKLMEKRIFPCLDINRSATRKEELLLGNDILNRVCGSCASSAPSQCHRLNGVLGVEDEGHKTNQEFLDSMSARNFVTSEKVWRQPFA